VPSPSASSSPYPSGLRYLHQLSLLAGNRFAEPAHSQRIKLLSAWRGVDERGLQLQVLDGKPVTTVERVEAVKLLEDEKTEGKAEFVRLLLLLEEMGADPHTTTRLDLSHRHLVNLNALAPYRLLRELNLSHNRISTLQGQCLHHLWSLESLDLRHNRLPAPSALASASSSSSVTSSSSTSSSPLPSSAHPTFQSLLGPLTGCDRLKHLCLAHCGNGEKDDLANDTAAMVFAVLRGVQTLDGHTTPHPLFTPHQSEALAFLYRIAGVGPNALVYVDLRPPPISVPISNPASGSQSKGMIESALFFPLLAALAEMRTVREMESGGNGWNYDPAILNPRQYIIFALGEQLKVLDGEAVTDAERLLSIRAVKKSDVNQVKKWAAVRERALRRAETRPGLKVQQQQQYHAARVGQKDDEKDHENARRRRQEQQQQQANEKANGKADIPMGPGFMDLERTTSHAKMGASSLDRNVAGGMGSEVWSRGSEVMKAITGTLINKAEIVINFLQIFGKVSDTF